jgi:hypothetical protein
MRYKGEYEPSYILDPVGTVLLQTPAWIRTLTGPKASNTFRPLTPALDKQLLGKFEHGSTAILDEWMYSSKQLTPGIAETTSKKQSTKSSDNSTSSDDNNSDGSESDEDEDMDEIPHPPPPGCLYPKSIPQSVINGLAINIPAGMFHPGGVARVDVSQLFCSFVPGADEFGRLGDELEGQ